MPYKLKRDKSANDSIWRQTRQLRFYRSMGLEPEDLNNPESSLQCSYCGKITARNCAHRFRHYSNCIYLPQVMEILGHPRMRWSRQRALVSS